MKLGVRSGSHLVVWRKDIFMCDRDRSLFLTTLGEAAERLKLDVFAFVLMDNHYHLLLRTNLGNLSKAMQWLGLTYTRRLNNRLKRSGHLFQGRFKAILVENESYMTELSCYIHRNPLRAGMVKRLIDYRWSSYPVYAYGKKGPEWLRTDLILSFFAGKDKGKHQAYRERVQNYAGEEGRLWEDFRHGILLGSEEFVEKIRFLGVGTVAHKEIPQQKKVLASIDTMELVRRSSALLGREVEEFKRGGRLRGEAKEDRDTVIYALWETGLFGHEEIGRLFGVSYSAISHIIADMKLKKTDSPVRNKLIKVNSQFKM
jgi:putative transposase